MHASSHRLFATRSLQHLLGYVEQFAVNNDGNNHGHPCDVVLEKLTTAPAASVHRTMENIELFFHGYCRRRGLASFVRAQAPVPCLETCRHSFFLRARCLIVQL